MAKFFKKPAGNLRTPFYCFGAMAVGCLMSSTSMALNRAFQILSPAPLSNTSPCILAVPVPAR